MLKSMIPPALAFFIWSLLGVTINKSSLEPTQMLWGGSIVAVLISFLVMRIKEKKTIKSTFTSNTRFVAALLIVQGLHGLLWFIALKITPIGQAVLIHSLAPMFILFLGGYLIKEKYSSKSFLIICIGLVGLFMILWRDIVTVENVSLIGSILSLVTAFLIACSDMTTKKLSKDLTVSQLVFLINLGQVLFGSLLVLEDLSFLMTHAVEILVIGVGYMTIPFYLFVQGFKRLKAINVALIGYSEPFFAVAWGALFLGQEFTPLLLVGGALILASNYYAVKIETNR